MLFVMYIGHLYELVFRFRGVIIIIQLNEINIKLWEICLYCTGEEK